MRELLDPEALRLLEYLTLHDDPRNLAASLYGPAWREAVAVTEGGGYRTKRDPLPAFLADFLAEALLGVVGHDGRSTREGRSLGWWMRYPSGSWRPASVEEIGTALTRLVVALQTRAADQREAALRRFLAATDRAAKEAAKTDADAEALRVALLSGLAHAIASLGRTLSAAFTALRDRLPLPEPVLREIAREWLETALDLGDLTPDPRGRIAVADVRDAYERTRTVEVCLPLQTLYRCLDAILGPRHRLREWSLGALDVEPVA